MSWKDDKGIKHLVGRTVKSAEINQAKDLIVLQTDTGPLYLSWSGDCCSSCFLQHVSGTEVLVGSTIVEASNAEWVTVQDKDDYDVIETMGTNIRTTKGYVTFESRLEHNGYYGGQIAVSEVGPLDQYSFIREDDEVKNLKPLEDF